MSQTDELVSKFTDFASLTWGSNTPKAQRIWFLVYEPRQERRIRRSLGEFELAARRLCHRWIDLDVSGLFGEWMSANEYREAYFRRGELTESQFKEFKKYVADRIRELLLDPQVDDETIAVIHGIASLFGFLRISDLLKNVENDIRGRLLVLFPGIVQDTTYRLLNARDGWNYHAVPITI